MAKILKIVAKTFGFLFEWLLIAIIVFAFVIRTPQVQTYLAQKAAVFLSDELNTTVKVDKVEIVFLDKVVLKGVLILDLKKDSILYSNEILLTIDKLDLNKNKFVFGKATLTNGSVNINKSKDNGTFNFQFIADYFASESKTKSKPTTLVFKEIALQNFNLKYDDFRKSQLAFGLDYDHVNLKELSVNVNSLEIADENISFQLNDLKLKEQCGLEIDKFESQVKISSSGIKLSKTHLKTPKTKLNLSKLYLLYRNWEDFDEFVDKVKFDVRILPSSVSLIDVSYFAPDIQGMDSKLMLSGTIKEEVKSLNISNLDLRFGKRNIIKGDFILPDFRKGENAQLNENLKYAYINLNELERFNLPKGTKNLHFDKPISNFVFAEISNLKTNGILRDFNLIIKDLNTEIGSVSLENYLNIQSTNEGIAFSPVKKDSSLVNIANFNLAKLIEDSNFGFVNGKVKLNGMIPNDGDIMLENIEAKMNRFDFSKYAYSGITINNGSFKNDIIDADLKLDDPNVKLTYSGKVSIGKNQKYDIKLDVQDAMLSALGFTKGDNIKFSTGISCNLEGSSLDNIKGNVNADYISYTEAANNLKVPSLNVSLARTTEGDDIKIISSLLNANVKGKINYETVINDFLSELAVVFPSLIASEKTHIKGKSNFEFEIKTGDLTELLNIFVPDLKIKSDTKLSGNYNSERSNLRADLTSDYIAYQDLKLNGLKCNQTISPFGIIGTYNLNELNYGDSLKFSSVLFSVDGMNGILNSKLTWDPNTKNYSSIEWKTIVLEQNSFNFQLKPSFFSLNGLQWEIQNESDVDLSLNDLHVSNFHLSRDKQSIQINGCLSTNDNDKLKLDVQQLDLSELSQLLGLETELSGKFSGWSEISNPYTNFNYMGDARIENLFLNKEEIGNIQVMSDWNAKRESVILNGELEYKNQRTFDFTGNYDLKNDLLDMFLNFENTDIQFANAFLDPSLVKDIKGKINGKIRLKGSPSQPELDGKLKLNQGSALVELLGVKYSINGDINIEKDAFLLNTIPVKDEEGNTAALIGSINHHNFSDWNFDLQFNFEDDLFKRPLKSGMPVPLERFMVLKTKYKEGDVYYGTAYARGYANIEGTDKSVAVTVEVETKENTQIYFPMYGVSELKDNEDFITIIDKAARNKIKEDKIDLSGVDLDMKFKVNQNAKMNLIFNELTHDEIIASGKGEINLKLDQLNNIFLEGTYTILEGSKYNFTMVGLTKPFEIEKGSTIKWSGSPYNADININTFVNLKKVSILELSPELMDNSLANQEVNCYLKLNETLLNPSISFDIQAPRAPETGKALIRRVTSENDELNRQFFSLLIASKFQPLKGSISAGGSAALDLLESQINAALSNMTENYKLNVNYGEEKTFGEKSFEVGFKKGILNERVIISSSIGVESKNASGDGSSSTASNGASKSNALIGDVNIEYIINKKGTFRINIFNKSNTNSINEKAGAFTQGAGISYMEEFNNWNDFELIQYGLDLFRKEDKKKYKKKKNRTKIPIEGINNGKALTVPEKKQKTD
jgi:hypothetical protein